MQADLLRPYTKEDVLHALQDMSPTKSPSPDGFSALFFQKYWDAVGNDLSSVILQILNDFRDPFYFKYTYIALIPKLPASTQPSHFCPISLCNVTMKLVTKCIANRLKPVLPMLIDETQSAFVPVRLITDNALIAFETFHYLK